MPLLTKADIRITANCNEATAKAAREIAFKERKSVRQWAGEVIAKAVATHKPRKARAK